MEVFNDRSCALATSLTALSSKRQFSQKFQQQNAPAEGITTQSVRITHEAREIVNERRGLVDELSLELAQVASISRQELGDLVNVRDFFEPEQEFVQTEGGGSLQRGELIVDLTPELLPIGNFIVRCLLKRIDKRCAILESLYQRCETDLTDSKSRTSRDLQAIQQGWNRVSESRDKLVQRLRPERELILTDSCVVCTQLYAALHPDPDLSWLGLERHDIVRGIDMLRQRIRGLQSPYLLDRVAAALGSLRQLYDSGSPEQSPLDEAIATGGLVIDRKQGKAFWNKQQIVGLTRDQLRFLLVLAQKAVRRAVAGISDFYEKPVTDSAVSSAWERLKKKLPEELGNLVKPGPLKCTYQLKLEPERIHIFGTRK